MTQVLANIHNPEPALVASATLDGIAGAAIWASRLPGLQSWLFAPEGLGRLVFSSPALMTNLRFNALHVFNLPLVDEDLPAVEAVLMRSGLIEKVWLDHHYQSREQQALLLRNGVRLVNEPRHHLSSRLLLEYLNEPEPWMRELVEAVEQGPATAAEPWLSWLLVFLAVAGEPFGIRQAVSPLAERRFEAFDPALRKIGLDQWRQIREMAGGALHEVPLAAHRLVVVGLPHSRQQDYQLLVRTIFREKEAQLALVFFDQAPRMILAVNPPNRDEFDLLACGEALEQGGFHTWHYDRLTLFAQHDELKALAAIEKALTVLQAWASVKN